MIRKDDIVELLTELNERLAAEGIRAEVCIVGGAAMCLAFDARPSTKDVDAIFSPASRIRELVAQIGDERGFKKDWLNDGVKGYMSSAAEFTELFRLSNLVVFVGSPRYTLAMKCLSSRADALDKDDIIFLIKLLKIKDINEVFDIIGKFYPKNRVPAKTQFFLEEVFEEM